MDEMPTGILVALLGFGLGIVFGATAQRTNFCTMGAISDMVFMGDLNRFRAWMLAIAVAAAASQMLHLSGAVDLDESIYLTANLGWLGAIIGGLMFGFGMTQAGGCGSRTLVRLGAGNLKSLVVAIVLGIFAYMTLRGLIGLARVQIESLANLDLTEAGLTAQGMPDLIAGATGLSIEATRTALTLAVSAGLMWFCFKSPSFRASPRNIAAGLTIGAMAPLGWVVTGVVGYDEFDPTRLASVTFVAPVGESLVYLMTFTGASINFGIATVASHQDLSDRGFYGHQRHDSSYRRRRPHGHWRRHGDGLHHRSGHHRHLDSGPGIADRLAVDHRRRGLWHEVPGRGRHGRRREGDAVALKRDGSEVRYNNCVEIQKLNCTGFR
jgi:uncharacterized membrane protein YedE/YeeE